MSAAAPRPVRREQASLSAQDPVSEPAWSWPIDLTRYDRTPVLSPPEAAALTALGPSVRGWSQPRRQPSLWHALDRLVSPLAAIRATWSRQDPHQRTRADLAVAALLRMCAVERRPTGRGRIRPGSGSWAPPGPRFRPSIPGGSIAVHAPIS